MPDTRENPAPRPDSRVLFMRMDDELDRRIDERVAAIGGGLSRSEWARRVLKDALDQPIREIPSTEKV